MNIKRKLINKNTPGQEIDFSKATGDVSNLIINEGATIFIKTCDNPHLVNKTIITSNVKSINMKEGVTKFITENSIYTCKF